MTTPLNPASHQWLMLESDNTPMHLGALLMFRLPSSHSKDWLAQLGRSFADATAQSPWTLKRGGLFNNFWEPDPIFDAGFHFRRSALPSPGGERELGELVSRLHSIALDPERPLWECHLIEGLYDEQFAVYFKVHPALMDTQTFFRTLTGALSKTARSRSTAPWWTQEVTGWDRGSLKGAALKSIKELPAAGVALPRFLRNVVDSSRFTPGQLRRPFSSARSALNTRIGHQRRLATQSFAVSKLEKIATALNARTTELLLYLCGSVLRRFFKEYNALPDTALLAGFLDATVDNDLYREIDLVSLGTDSSDPATRLQTVQHSLRASRRFLEGLPSVLIPAYTFSLAVPFVMTQRSPLQITPPLFNIPVAGLAGPDKAVYLDGAKLQNLWPMAPLMQGNALSISWMIYAGRVNIGLNGDREALPHLQRMAVYMDKAISELEATINHKHKTGTAHGR